MPETKRKSVHGVARAAMGGNWTILPKQTGEVMKDVACRETDLQLWSEQVQKQKSHHHHHKKNHHREQQQRICRCTCTKSTATTIGSDSGDRSTQEEETLLDSLEEDVVINRKLSVDSKIMKLKGHFNLTTELNKHIEQCSFSKLPLHPIEAKRAVESCEAPKIAGNENQIGEAEDGDILSTLPSVKELVSKFMLQKKCAELEPRKTAFKIHSLTARSVPRQFRDELRIQMPQVTDRNIKLIPTGPPPPLPSGAASVVDHY